MLSMGEAPGGRGGLGAGSGSYLLTFVLFAVSLAAYQPGSRICSRVQWLVLLAASRPSLLGGKVADARSCCLIQAAVTWAALPCALARA